MADGLLGLREFPNTIYLFARNVSPFAATSNDKPIQFLPNYKEYEDASQRYQDNLPQGSRVHEIATGRLQRKK
jgi:hypothetical protein